MTMGNHRASGYWKHRFTMLESANLEPNGSNSRPGIRFWVAFALIVVLPSIHFVAADSASAQQDGVAATQLISLRTEIIELTTDKPLDNQTLAQASDAVLEMEQGNGQIAVVDDRNTDRIKERLGNHGTLQTKARPVLTTGSGRLSSISEGEHFPIKLPKGPREMEFDWKFNGAHIAIVPTLRSNGKIHVKLQINNSGVDARNEMNLNGVRVPAFCQHRTDWEGEVDAGNCIVVVAKAACPQPESHRYLIAMVRPTVN